MCMRSTPQPSGAIYTYKCVWGLAVDWAENGWFWILSKYTNNADIFCGLFFRASVCAVGLTFFSLSKCFTIFIYVKCTNTIGFTSA